MKMNYSRALRATFASFTTSDKIIARFGSARLVRRADGRHALLGGSAAEHAQAYEWCSLFAPEVVFTALPLALGSWAFAE